MCLLPWNDDKFINFRTILNARSESEWLFSFTGEGDALFVRMSFQEH